MTPRLLDLLEHYCEVVLFQSDAFEPPINLGRVAEFLNVRAIDECDMAAEASITKCNDGFWIRVRKDRPLSRRRFSIAHELGHIVLDRMFGRENASVPVRFRSRASVVESHDRDEEFLADHAAGCLLMPSGFLRAQVRDTLDLRRLERASDLAQTSVGTALIRLVRITTTPIVVLCLRAVDGGSPDVIWCKSSEGVCKSALRSDLDDPLVLAALTQSSRLIAPTLNYEWDRCQSVSRTLAGYTHTYVVAQVRSLGPVRQPPAIELGKCRDAAVGPSGDVLRLEDCGSLQP